MQSLLDRDTTEHGDNLEHITECLLCGYSSFKERFPDTRQDSNFTESYAAYLCTHPGYGVHPSIVECTNCGLIFTNPRPSATSIAENYSSVEDQAYLDAEAARFATFERRMQWLQRHTGVGQGRRLLDVGAYTGVFVEVAQRAGWEATGLEPSHWASGYANRQGRKVHQGLIQEHPFEPESFDAITLWDVIEHVPDPVGVLTHTYELLKSGGWIAVHTMDTNSPFAKLMGNRWPWLMEMHIVYFTKKTLRETLEAAGFDVVEIRVEGRYLQLQYLVSRLQSYSQTTYRVLDSIIRRLGLSQLNVPINFGDLITAYAVKRGED